MSEKPVQKVKSGQNILGKGESATRSEPDNEKQKAFSPLYLDFLALLLSLTALVVSIYFSNSSSRTSKKNLDLYLSLIHI